ncbi:MAG: 2-succinyl-5-enolpyruvyl-6-hydroxy-3-cyclohexene-1-carboxylic-acid synthase [Flavobacteriia bacterium]|nr:MAG: 2-succinyl-5-enolpyruvyl-6-hydroxy-3-cyclohexene-1-carboxylic-acid synthase [Flavobacteriia bacterium]
MPHYPKNELAQLVVGLCKTHHINDVVISPGSRNAPLIIGFTNTPEIETYSVVDERSAAFMALGMAQQSRTPAALVCTSGSALLNYYPAVAEAFYSKIPLVVISADRPKKFIDIGDGQTIRQENVFKNHILFSANLEEMNAGASKEIFDRNSFLIQEALRISNELKGPVHINVPFDEPLYDFIEDFTVDIPEKGKIIKDSLLDEVPLDVDDLQKYADIWNASSKKMVLLGSFFPDEMIQTQLEHLLKDPSVLIFTETTSNVYHHKFINSIDKLIIPLTEQELQELQPEILLTFGGMVVSKKIKQFLRKLPPKYHWHVDKYNAPDTYHCLKHHFMVSPQLFFSQFFFLTKTKESLYQKKWLSVKDIRLQKHMEYLEKIIFSDLKVFEIILKNIPQAAQLQLSNSSVIRYSQLFDIDPSLKVFCNRGTSGIDGSTSTAVGASLKVKERTVFITGDISFFYDSNALWNKYIRKDFRIILINNSGGGIFRFLAGPKKSTALEYFETPHDMNAESLCELYRFDYFKAANEKDLNEKLKRFFEVSEKPALLEIFTPASENDLILKDYFKNLF